jgi:drug/metabolite transporter (DMT)-like permease
VVLAIVFLDEHPRFYHLVGAILILGGVFIAGTRRGSSMRAETTVVREPVAGS